MTDRELLLMAWNALETITSKKERISYYCAFAVEIEALRARLAQPEPVIQARKEGDLIVADLPQVPRGSGGIRPEPTIDGWPLWSGLPQPEPVAYIDVETRNLSWAKPTRWETPTVVKMDKVPLYTAPPKKEWVGLMDEEIAEIGKTWLKGNRMLPFALANAIEAKLKEKNI
jgi:hypothetical protein